MSNSLFDSVWSEGFQEALRIFGRDWMLEAKCADYEPNLWQHKETFPRAIAICIRCPVQPTCLAFALEAKETEGVWGGVTPLDRWKMNGHR